LSTSSPLDDDDVVEVVVVVVAAAVVEVVVVVGEKMFAFVGLAVGDKVGRADVVGNGVGRADEIGTNVIGGAGDVPPQPFPTLIATSAQFQNCSGTPRPSGGML